MYSHQDAVQTSSKTTLEIAVWKIHLWFVWLAVFLKYKPQSLWSTGDGLPCTKHTDTDGQFLFQLGCIDVDVKDVGSL